MSAQALVARVGIKDEIRWCDVKNAELRGLAETVAACALEVGGKGTFKDEFVTAGGVALTGACHRLTL
jgi:predicted flavoprotein YhiN